MYATIKRDSLEIKYQEENEIYRRIEMGYVALLCGISGKTIDKILSFW